MFVMCWKCLGDKQAPPVNYRRSQQAWAAFVRCKRLLPWVEIVQSDVRKLAEQQEHEMRKATP